MRYFIFILFFVFSNILLANNSIVINEVCALNDKSLLDEDYEASDWIELYNTTDSSINLKDWRIYDKNDFSSGWILPDTVIAAKSYLVLFASDKDRFSNGNYLIEAGGYGTVEWAIEDYFHYKYLKTAGDFDISLNIRYFYSNFLFGLTGLMLRDSLTSTSPYIAMFSQIQSRGSYFCLFRTNPNTKPDRIHAVHPIEYPDVNVRIQRKGDTVRTYLLQKNSYLWLELGKFYYKNEDSVYLGITISGTTNQELSKGLFKNLVFQGDTISIAELNTYDNTNHIYNNYFFSELHTNFDLNKEGETVYLWDNTDSLSDSLLFPELKTDVSYGRFPDADTSLKYFFPSTPNQMNVNARNGYAETPKFSKEAGWYDEGIELNFLNNNPDAKIYYTLNSSEPTENSILYAGSAIKIDTTTIIRAKTFSENLVPSQIVSKSYFIQENVHKLPIVSVIADSIDLWDVDKGIMYIYNLMKEMEIPADFEFYEQNSKNPDFTAIAGMKLHGSYSRSAFPQKSFSLIAKNKYGISEFEYPFFKDNDYIEYDKILLRNSGNDWKFLFMRDEYVCVLSNKIGLAASKFNPTVLYINGKYWGMQHLRERIDEEYLSTKYEIPKKNITLLENNGVLKTGNRELYDNMKKYVLSNDAIKPEVYEEIEKLIDIPDFIKYIIMRTWTCNLDWPDYNQKFWSSPDYDNKWRWILYDSDITLNYSKGYTYNLFKFLDKTNYEFSKLSSKIFQNKAFQKSFVNKYADLLNTDLHQLNTIPLLDSLCDLIRDEIPRHQARWDSSATFWDERIISVKEFLEKRNPVIREQLINLFDLKGTSEVFIDFNNKHNGYVRINNILTERFPDEIIYFQGIPITLEAVPKPGYEFVSWGNELLPDTCFLEIAFDTSEVVLNPVFRLKENDDRTIIFNEIMYKSSKDLKCGDWVELYNISDKTVDISNWIFKDEDDKHIFTIPQETLLNSKDYLVLCESSEDFSNTYPNILNYIGNFDFGLGRPDIIRLFDSDNKLIDSVAYSNAAPWDANADGTGYSLELNKFNIDNNNPLNWYASLVNGGTPGELNSEYVSVIEKGTENNLYFTCYPNPLSDYSVIEYAVPFNTQITINIYDLLGNKIKEIYSGLAEKNRIHFSTESLAKGVYFIKMEAVIENIKAVKVLQVVKGEF